MGGAGRRLPQSRPRDGAEARVAAGDHPGGRCLSGLPARLRRLCLALPEATEKLTWDDPTFRVRDRIFVLGRTQHAVPAIWLKAPPGAQAILVGADPDRFFVPPYVGHKGWVGVNLAPDPDWGEIAFLVRRSYRMTAPKRLAALVAD